MTEMIVLESQHSLWWMILVLHA